MKVAIRIVSPIVSVVFFGIQINKQTILIYIYIYNIHKMIPIISLFLNLYFYFFYKYSASTNLLTEE